LAGRGQAPPANTRTGGTGRLPDATLRRPAGPRRPGVPRKTTGRPPFGETAGARTSCIQKTTDRERAASPRPYCKLTISCRNLLIILFSNREM
jgi:hypothetical protein